MHHFWLVSFRILWDSYCQFMASTMQRSLLQTFSQFFVCIQKRNRHPWPKSIKILCRVSSDTSNQFSSIQYSGFYSKCIRFDIFAFSVSCVCYCLLLGLFNKREMPGLVLNRINYRKHLTLKDPCTPYVPVYITRSTCAIKIEGIYRKYQNTKHNTWFISGAWNKSNNQSTHQI